MLEGLAEGPAWPTAPLAPDRADRRLREFATRTGARSTPGEVASECFRQEVGVRACSSGRTRVT